MEKPESNGARSDHLHPIREPGRLGEEIPHGPAETQQATHQQNGWEPRFPNDHQALSPTGRPAAKDKFRAKKKLNRGWSSTWRITGTSCNCARDASIHFR